MILVMIREFKEKKQSFVLKSCNIVNLWIRGSPVLTFISLNVFLMIQFMNYQKNDTELDAGKITGELHNLAL